MTGWIIARAEGSSGQRTSDGASGVDGAIIDEGAPLDPDLLLLPRRLERLKVDGEESSDAQPRPPLLRVLSWNTLADGLAQLGRFSRCPRGALSWPTRRRLVLREIERSGADIACLQEVNRPGDLEPPLREAGYDGAFWAKPVSPAARLGFPGDGSAVLWKRDRFDLVSVVGKPFEATAPDASAALDLGASSIAAPAAAMAAASGVGGGRRGVQGLLLVTLRDRRDRGRKVVVACVHLKAKEGAANDAARAAQAREAVRALEAEAGRGAEEEGGGGSSGLLPAARPPATVAILAGDFNAEPGSAPYEAARGSRLLQLRCLWECEREEREGEEGGGGAGEAAAASGGRRRGGDGDAAAAARDPGPRPPPYTTYKFRSEESESDASDGACGAAGTRSESDACGSGGADQLSQRVSDFVFFSPRSAAAVARWAPMDFEREVRDGLPCERYPSDHAAVLAVLRPK